MSAKTDRSLMFASVAVRSQSADELVLELVPCPLCGGDRSELILSASDSAVCGAETVFHVVRCCRCGLHFTNPRPTPRSIGQFYSPSYRPHSGQAQLRRPLRSWYPLDWLQCPESENSKPRLLDFGCGGGHFLAWMNGQGWEAVGLDVSATAVELIRNNVGVLAFDGSLPHDALEPESFDFVTMWHSLEHVHDPKRILQEARLLLLPKGRLAIATPNFDGWPRRWFGSSWYGLDLPRHLIHFGRKTLTRILDESGFRVVDVRHSRHADWLRSSAQRKRFSFPESLLRFKPLARAGAWLCQRAGKSDAILVLAERM
jgi:2-polyprenyl-3-methyl-5-hydroxy-6-metoxy-1,4-benzoquinol methylase